MKANYIALIPAYEPEHILIDLLKQLHTSGFQIVVVNDGSTLQYSQLFQQASQYATVLTHNINKGKGTAIKTGLAYLQESFANECTNAKYSNTCHVIVTMDADGQHLVKDALRICQFAQEHTNTLVLGSRQFKEQVPLRSKLGNSITRFVYHCSTGRKLQDTQTGLRAFDASLIPKLLSISGNRYEYEMNVLLEFVHSQISIQEIQIETIYLNNNESSHFNTLKDSASSQDTDNLSYSDNNISITITQYREYDTTIYVADVQLSSSEYLKTAFAQNAYGKNVTQKTSEIAETCQAILAINGDYYGARENGYVMRNGTLYRDTATDNQEDLVIYQDGSFSIITESETSADTLVSNQALHVLSFGPALITDNAISVTADEEVGKAMASNPRTAIGIVDNLHYLFVVSDGRTSESEGLTLYQLAEFMQSLNANIAYNLDGGGSSTMYFNGQIINNPTTNGKKIQERSVSDIVYIGY